MAEPGPAIFQSLPLNHRFYANSRPPKCVCFSFAAYAKFLIGHVKSLGIPVLPGVSDSEFDSIESAFGFSFPPDLRSFLKEGLPVAQGFPNWRSSSFQQLHILLKLPTLFLLKEISRGSFWCDAWGYQPDDRNTALDMAERLFVEAPLLVPIYRNCYIPSSPNVAGNPVFYVNGGDVRVLSFDLSGFFQKVEFLHLGDHGLSECLTRMSAINTPAWAATEARWIVFWSDVSEKGRKVKAKARDVTGGWWNGGLSGVDGCMEEAFWRLKEGGWIEEEVREMMMMNGADEQSTSLPLLMNGPDNVNVMSSALLRGGWNMEDVAYSLDLLDNPTNGFRDLEPTFEFPLEHYQINCSRVDRRLTLRQVLEV